MAFYSRSRMLSRTAFCVALAASSASLWSVPSTKADEGYNAGSLPVVQTSAVAETDQVVAADCDESSLCEPSPNCDLACDEYVAQCGCSDSWWDGGETDLQRRLKTKGITFDNNVTSFYYGVAGGGEEQEFRFAGHGDYLMNMDLMKMGGPPGLFLKIRAEHRMGETMIRRYPCA